MHDPTSQNHWHEPSGNQKAGLGTFKRVTTPYDKFMEEQEIPIVRASQHNKRFDLRTFLRAIAVEDGGGELAQLLEWPAEATLLRFRVSCGADGSAKPSEVVAAVFGSVDARVRIARVRLCDAQGGDPLQPMRLPVVTEASAGGL